MLHNKSNTEILTELDSYVCGHTDAKKALINLINRSVTRHHQKWILGFHKDHLIQTHKCLLVGQSGTGKTHLVESLQSVVDFPLVRIDATKLNPTGATSGIKSDDLISMIRSKAYEYCETKKGYYHSLEGTIDKMVVFVDEIDKLGRSSDSSGNWNNHVQANFLTLFDNKSEYAGVSFIFAGAFTDITKVIPPSNTLGFRANSAHTTTDDIDGKLVKSGLLPELVGRLTSIVELDRFSPSDYERILRDVLLPKKQIDMAYFGLYNINLEDDEIAIIVKSAATSGQGIRALQRSIDKHFADLEFNHEEGCPLLLSYEENE